MKQQSWLAGGRAGKSNFSDALLLRRFLAVMMMWGLIVHGAAAEPQSYAGQEQRQIKALSLGEVQDYLAGRGMGLAKAAELNHYPGPLHVLALAEQLDLSVEQRVRSEQIFQAMQAAAKKLGTELVAQERKLDQQFAAGTITHAELGELLRKIGELYGRLRTVHLQAHLEQRAILTASQITRYDVLRGYVHDTGSANGDTHSHHH